jgi:hypothetical protein
MDIDSQLAEMIISDIPLTDMIIISRAVEFLGDGAILALALVSKRLKDLVKEICPTLVSVPHMHLDRAALVDWAVDKMGMPVEDLCEIKLIWRLFDINADILHVAVWLPSMDNWPGLIGATSVTILMVRILPKWR